MFTKQVSRRCFLSSTAQLAGVAGLGAMLPAASQMSFADETGAKVTPTVKDKKDWLSIGIEN